MSSGLLCDVSDFREAWRLQVPCTQAPASRLKRFAEAAIKECGDYSFSDIIRRAGNTKALQNAERDLHELFEAYHLTVPVRMTKLVLGPTNNVDLWCVTLHDWLSTILNDKPELLLGGFAPGCNATLLLQSYWKGFRQCFPDHEVFVMHDQDELGRCIPIYLHLDEGVGQRKRAVLIVAWQAVFGLSTPARFDELRRGVGNDLDSVEDCMMRAQFHNTKGSTYKSRFLFSALSKQMYSKGNEMVYEQMLEYLAAELNDLMATGIKVDRETWWAIGLGLKGDAPALKKAANMKRSFANLGRGKGICPDCLAGLPGCPFEDVSGQAAWRNTIALEEPWAVPGPLSRVPGRSYHPEWFYRKDPFHVFKQSLAGHFFGISHCPCGGEWHVHEAWSVYSSCGDPQPGLRRLRLLHQVRLEGKIHQPPQGVYKRNLPLGQGGFVSTRAFQRIRCPSHAPVASPSHDGRTCGARWP